MTQFLDISPAPMPMQHIATPFWALVDVGLLFAVMLVSSDALIYLGFGQSLIWLLCYALTLLRVLMNWPLVFEMLMRNKLLFAYPLTCLASVVWSQAPAETMVSAFQLTITFLIASYLGWRYSLDVIVKAVVVVLSITVALSLVHWASGVFPWKVYSNAGGLVGIYSHKNMLGQRALFCALAIIATLLMARWQTSLPFKAAAFLSLGGTVLALALSRSMTSVLLLPPMVALFIILSRRHIPSQLFTALAILSGLAIALVPAALVMAGIDPVQTVLDSVGKDATLTGRTQLWSVAADVSQEHPIFGVGYSAFWAAPEFAYERLLTQHAGATTSVSFHNFIMEILVGCGWLGVLSILAILLTSWSRLRIYLARYQSVSAALGLTILAAVVITSLLGPSFYRGHEFMIVLIIAITVSAQEDMRQYKQHFYPRFPVQASGRRDPLKPIETDPITSTSHSY